MKKSISVFLTIALVLTLAVSMSISVFADEIEEASALEPVTEAEEAEEPEDAEEVEEVEAKETVEVKEAEIATEDTEELVEETEAEDSQVDEEFEKVVEEIEEVVSAEIPEIALLTRGEAIAALVNPMREMLAQMADFVQTLIELSVITPEEAEEMIAEFNRDIAAYIEAEGLFTDVDEFCTYYDEIAWAKAMGIVIGDGTGAFRPDDMIMRQDLAVILNRTLSIYDEGLEYPQIEIADFDSVSDYAKEAVQMAVAMSFIMLDDDGNFNPFGGITSDDMQTALGSAVTTEETVPSEIEAEEAEEVEEVAQESGEAA